MSRQDSPWKAFSLVSLIGMDIAILTVIGYWVGQRVDTWLGTEPLGLIIGVFTGVGIGILSIIPLVKKHL